MLLFDKGLSQVVKSLNCAVKGLKGDNPVFTKL